MVNVSFELKGKSIYVAGHRGMVGSALVRRLAREDVKLLTVSRGEVDLRNQAAVFDWLAKARPQVIFLAAAKVGSIVAKNTLRAEFIYDNIAIAANVIHAAHLNGAQPTSHTQSLRLPALKWWRRIAPSMAATLSV